MPPGRTDATDDTNEHRTEPTGVETYRAVVNTIRANTAPQSDQPVGMSRRALLTSVVSHAGHARSTVATCVERGQERGDLVLWTDADRIDRVTPLRDRDGGTDTIETLIGRFHAGGDAVALRAVLDVETRRASPSSAVVGACNRALAELEVGE